VLGSMTSALMAASWCRALTLPHLSSGIAPLASFYSHRDLSSSSHSGMQRHIAVALNGILRTSRRKRYNREQASLRYAILALSLRRRMRGGQAYPGGSARGWTLRCENTFWLALMFIGIVSYQTANASRARLCCCRGRYQGHRRLPIACLTAHRARASSTHHLERVMNSASRIWTNISITPSGKQRQLKNFNGLISYHRSSGQIFVGS